jgi:hypothetical protein
MSTAQIVRRSTSSEVLAVALVALAGAFLATPYRLVRRRHSHRAAPVVSQSDGVTVAFAYAP